MRIRCIALVVLDELNCAEIRVTCRVSSAADIASAASTSCTSMWGHDWVGGGTTALVEAAEYGDLRKWRIKHAFQNPYLRRRGEWSFE